MCTFLQCTLFYSVHLFRDPEPIYRDSDDPDVPTAASQVKIPSLSYIYTDTVHTEVEFLNSEELSLIKSTPLPAQLPRPGRS